ncbi:uncharacterized protein LOC118435064 [Folsomia candida]|nr:uncharacterized protein LOC118435064 [Folsomia candida]
MVMMMPALKYISYLIPTSFGRLTVIFRQPRLSHDVFQSVFSYQIWVVWILVWISIAITWLIINHVWSTKLSSTTLSEDDSVEKKIRNEIPDSTMHSFTEVCLWCFSAICCKGWHNQPKEISSKTVVLIGLTFAYIISIFFSASLTSNLATETIPIKTFSDFALSNLDLYGDRRLPLVRDIVSDVYYKTRRIKQFKKGKTIDSYFMRINDSFQTILTSKSGFVTFEDAAKSESVSLKAGYSNAYFCETISAITISRTVFPTAMFVRKGSHLREVFNQKIMLLIERGIIFRLNVIYNKKTLVTCQTTEENYRGGLGLTDLSIAYIISSVGIVLCVGVLLIEKLAFGCTESKAMSWMRRHIFP